MLDPHEVLGVGPDATPDALQRAFKRAVRRHHPDTNPGDPRAAERLRTVISAYQHLRSTPKPRPPAAAEPPTRLVVVACQLRGADLHGTLSVPPDRSTDGWLTVELAALDACPSCNGVGWEEVAGSWGRTERWDCESCHGAGILSVRRRVRMRVPAKSADGTKVRLKGIGLARPSMGRGDAFIQLRWA